MRLFAGATGCDFGATVFAGGALDGFDPDFVELFAARADAGGCKGLLFALPFFGLVEGALDGADADRFGAVGGAAGLITGPDTAGGTIAEPPGGALVAAVFSADASDARTCPLIWLRPSS